MLTSRGFFVNCQGLGVGANGLGGDFSSSHSKLVEEPEFNYTTKNGTIAAFNIIKILRREIVKNLIVFFKKHDQHVKLFKKYRVFDEHVKSYRNEIVRLKDNDVNIFIDFYRRTVSLVSPAMLVFYAILLINFLVYEHYEKQAYVFKFGIIILSIYCILSIIVVFIDLRKSFSIMYTWIYRTFSVMFFLFYIALIGGVATIGTWNAAKMYSELKSIEDKENIAQDENIESKVNDKYRSNTPLD